MISIKRIAIGSKQYQNKRKKQQQSFQSTAHYYYYHYYLQRAIVLNISAYLRSINKNGMKEVMYI